MNSFELIEKYLPKAVDKYFAESSKTAILEQGSKFIDVNFAETGYVKIASMLLDGLSDYYKAQTGVNGGADYASYAGNEGSGYRDGFAIGGTTLTWEIFKLQYVRGKQFRIDYIENEETASIIIGNAVEEFNRLKVVPEVDACRFSLMADACSVSLGNALQETTASLTNGIVKAWNTAFEWFSEHEVPAEEQIIFVSPVVMGLVRNSTELTKFITQGDYRNGAGLDFTVEKYIGRPIIEVPSNRFFTNVLLTNNGYRVQSSSKLINYMVVSSKAVLPIRKLEWNKVYGPDMSGIAGFHGYIINYLLYHGLIIPKNKVTAVYYSFNTTTATTKVNTLSIDTVAGSVQYSWKLRNYFTNPAGLRGKVVGAYVDASASSGTYAKDGFTLGATYTADATSFDVPLDTQMTATSAQTTAFFAVVDASGKIVAVADSTGVTLVRHA